MADQEQLERLVQGVEGWNQWRQENPGIIPDLNGANLRGADLRGADLRGTDLSGAYLISAYLISANLICADLICARLSGANLISANLRNASLYDVDLRGANLKGAYGLTTEQIKAAQNWQDADYSPAFCRALGLPLLLSAATPSDLSLLAAQAQDAELDEDYDLAESLWWQVIENESGQSSPRTPVLQPFVFDVLTFNANGQESSRERSQAEYFIEDLGNGIGLEMVLIPGSNFLNFRMGTPGRGGSDDEKPQHSVTVQPFLMGKFAVTQEQWRAVAGLPKLKCDLAPDPAEFKGSKRPVEQVSWDEAVEFCDRLSRKTGRQYRLPSEAEWEYACRAGTTTPFHFGEILTTDLANYGNHREQTTDVGSFSPNAFGLYDMHGNVWECCLDHRHSNYEGATTDGSAWVKGGNPDRRVMRGGSWLLNPGYCRSACRLSVTRDYRFNHLGFRVCCVPPRSLLSA